MPSQLCTLVMHFSSGLKEAQGTKTYSGNILWSRVMTVYHHTRRISLPFSLAVTALTILHVFSPSAGCQVFCQPPSAQQLDNLAAFARLYGYVRFFHPSDEAAQLDWDRFAIYGCARTLACGERSTLRDSLMELFAPIAPSVHLYGVGDIPPAVSRTLIPQDTSGLRLVSWQHLGVGLSPQSVYRSIRLNRRNVQPVGNSMGFGTISASLDPAALRGKQIAFRAAVKMDQKSKGQLWLRVDRPGNTMGFFDNMGDRPIHSPEWRNYEIAGTVDSDAVRISFGCMLMGAGQLWVDNLRMLAGQADHQTEVTLTNSDFENDAPGSPPQGWSSRTPGYVAEVTDETASTGKRSVCLRAALIEQPAELFTERLSAGETIFCTLPGGISCTVPLTLFADSAGTIPRPDKKALVRLNSAMESTLPPRLSGNERIVRLADVVIAWNVFQHFYPYFDVTDVDWEAQLQWALRQAWDDTSELAFVKTLQRLVARLRDGHGRAVLVTDTTESFVAPIQWTWIENALVVTDTFDTSGTGPSVGDIVTMVNGIPAARALEAEEAYISGATVQWRTLGATASLLNGPRNSRLLLTTVSSNGKTRNLALDRTLTLMEYFTLQKARQRPTAKLAEGVYYVNLSSSTMVAIDSLMPDLATARGVICDLRGYPNGNHGLISHLLTQPDTSTHWMGIPKTIYPDRKRPPQYSYSGWSMQPLQPHIAGRVVFLTDGRAISYAESYMSFIEHYKLADIVGEPTAGTNGNVNPFSLPGGYRLMWTGMRVTKHDGSRHHGVGIQPTLVVHRTVKGIRQGRDEQLEAALALITKAPH